MTDTIDTADHSGEDEFPLSDGSFFYVRHDTSPGMAMAQRDQHEAELFAKYSKQAAAQNAPVYTDGHVYSATRAYPNTYVGQGMAWADHNLMGNWANTNIVDAINKATNGGADTLAGSIGRIESDVPGILDIPGAGINMVKHYTPLGDKYDIPSLSGTIRSKIGIPEIPDDAGLIQRTLEGGSSALLGGGSAAHGIKALPSLVEAARAFGGAAAGTIASHLGGEFGGEAGSFFGGLLGGGGADLATRKVFHKAGGALGHEDAPDIQESGDALGFQPSATTLSGPMGQRILKILGALPAVGQPVEKANMNTIEALKYQRDAAASNIAGPGGIPPEITPESIGQALIDGAQEAIPKVKEDQSRPYGNINRIMEDQGKEVDLAPAGNAIEHAQDTKPSLVENADMVRGLLRKATEFAPGGPAYDERTRGPAPALPQPTQYVPWTVAKDARTGLAQKLRAAEMAGLGVPDNMVAALKKSLTDGMRVATQRAGLRNAFDKARAKYAEMSPILDRLYAIGGKPLGDTGGFEKTPPAGDVANWFFNQNQNSANLEPLANSATFPEKAWGRAAGQLVGRMGNADQGTFRPEFFYKAWKNLSDPVRLQLTQGAQGATGQVAATLGHIANVARNVVTPVSRHGLMAGLGTAAAVEAAMHGAESLGSHVLPWGTSWVAPTMLGWGLSKGFESQSYARGAAGRPMMAPGDWTAFARANLPAAGAVTSQDNPFRARLEYDDTPRPR